MTEADYVNISAKISLFWQFLELITQATCWKAHRVAFGAMVPYLEHKLTLISMICRFQKCYWECWNMSGTLESFTGDGCSM